MWESFLVKMRGKRGRKQGMEREGSLACSWPGVCQNKRERGRKEGMERESSLACSWPELVLGVILGAAKGRLQREQEDFGLGVVERDCA